MREFTKSMMSYTWAMSVFGVQQMVNVFRPSQATESFDNVTEATRDELGDGWRAAFRAGDNLQRGMVDLAFGMFGLGMFNGRGGQDGRGGRGGWGTGCGVSDMGRRTGDVIRESVNAAGQAADAFGRVTQGAASYAADTTRQAAGRTNRRGARYDTDNRDRTYDRTYNRSDDREFDHRHGHYQEGGGWQERGGRATSDVGRQTADAVGQGIRAMGEAADAVGQTMEGAAYATAAAMGGGDQAAGRGPSDTSGTRARGASSGQTQSWGAPSRGSGKSRRS
jgi:hypothetical protein